MIVNDHYGFVSVCHTYALSNIIEYLSRVELDRMCLQSAVQHCVVMLSLVPTVLVVALFGSTASSNPAPCLPLLKMTST